MSKNTLLSELINYISANSSGNVVIAAPSSGYALDVTGTGRFTGALTGTSAAFSDTVTINKSAAVSSLIIKSSSSTTGLWLYLNGLNATLSNQDNGNLSFQTNGTDRLIIASTGAATFSSSVTASAMSINTTSTSFTPLFLNAEGNYASSGNMTSGFAIANTTAGRALNMGVYESGAYAWIQAAYVNNADTTFALALQPRGGNVGIGTTSPMTFGSFTNLTIASSATNNYSAIFLVNSSVSIRGSWYQNGGNQINFGTATAHPLVFDTNDVERMRITSGGSLLVGLTAVSGNVAGDIWNSGSIYVATASNGSTGQGGVGIFSTNIDIGHANGTSNGTAFARFIYNGGVIGSITQSGTTAVLFNVTSDYRLKEDLKPIKGLEIVNKIKVYDYKWKSDNSRMDGVLAHELQEILPYAVTGVKDGEQMQQVDYSKIVPVMVQAIKDLKAELDTLKNK